MGLTLTPCMGRKCHHFINVGKYPRDCAHRPGMGTVKTKKPDIQLSESFQPVGSEENTNSIPTG